MKKDYQSGLKAEKYYMNHGISMILYRQKSEDLRHNHIEGDFRLVDGSALIDVKMDRRCFADGRRATHNIPIEIMNPHNPHGHGWFYHCAEDGVTDIIFICYLAEEQPPYCVIRIKYAELQCFISAMLEDEQYKAEHMRKTWDKVENLCVPVNDILSIAGTRILYNLDKQEAAPIITALMRGGDSR